MRRFTPKPPITPAEMLARLATRLANTPPHLRDRLTADSLAASTGVTVRECEYRLTIARQKWAAE